MEEVCLQIFCRVQNVRVGFILLQTRNAQQKTFEKKVESQNKGSSNF